MKNTDKKLSELLLHIGARCTNLENFGVVKLNKILFFSDAIAYARFGSSITGTAYKRQMLGPVPGRIAKVKSELSRNGRAVVKKVPAPGGKHNEERFFTLKPADTSIFTAAELKVVEEVIQRLGDHTGNELSALSHQFGGWKLAVTGETIPLATIFIPEKPHPLTPSQRSWAQGVVRTLGGAVAA